MCLSLCVSHLCEYAICMNTCCIIGSQIKFDYCTMLMRYINLGNRFNFDNNVNEIYQSGIYIESKDRKGSTAQIIPFPIYFSLLNLTFRNVIVMSECSFPFPQTDEINSDGWGFLFLCTFKMYVPDMNKGTLIIEMQYPRQAL